MEIQEDEFFGTDDVVAEVDTEVKRVSDTFRFALKYKEQFQASGIEFSDLRQYVTSDDASRIDWKNSAKSQDLFVKEYEEEKDMDVFIVLDASDSMMFGTTEKMKSEYAAIVAAAIAYASTDAGIDVGFGMYANNQMFMTPDGGDTQYQRILHEVARFDNYGGEFDLEDALNSVIGQIKQNTALFIISDFIRPKGDWKSKMLVANEKFRHVMNVMVKDLRDYKLPESGNMRFEDIGGDEQIVANTSRIRREYNEEAQKREQRIEDKIDASGASMIKIDTRDEFSARFAEYFDEAGEEW
jgi:uncharacterized protein (DUF58 family)